MRAGSAHPGAATPTPLLRGGRRAAVLPGWGRRVEDSVTTGAAPALLVTAASALVVVGLVATYQVARTTTSRGLFVAFWLFVLGAFGLAAHVGLRMVRSDRGRALVLVGIGVFTYLPKFMMSVNGPVYFDEYGQFRHVEDVLRQSLFPPSSYLPVLKDYPGLALATILVHESTRLSLWHSGQVVVLAAHCASALTVFGIAREGGARSRTAFVAGVLFALNPNFMFFDTQFSYESLGITLALLVLYCLLRARRATTAHRAATWAAAALAAGVTCVVTHHISSFVMLAWALAAVALVRRRSGVPPLWHARWLPIGVLACIAGAEALWLGLVARTTLAYLGPHVEHAYSDLAAVVLDHIGIGPSGAAAAHTPFAGSGPLYAENPAWERWAAYASPLIALVLVVLGAREARSWPRDRRSALLPIAGTVVAYFASLPFALTTGGGELAHRSWSFAYLGVAVFGSLGVERIAGWRRSRRTHARKRRAAADRGRLGSTRGGALRRVRILSVSAAIGVLAVGNVAAGESVLYRFPGPYVFGTDSRSTTPELLGLARWADRHLPAGSRVIADRTTDEIITAYTDLQIATPLQAAAYAIYEMGDGLSPGFRALLARDGFRYFILDTRIETSHPEGAFYSGYHGYYDINPAALRAMHDTRYLVLIHRTAHYEVFALHPGSPPGVRR